MLGALLRNFPHLLKVFHASSDWVIRQCLAVAHASDQDTTEASDSRVTALTAVFESLLSNCSGPMAAVVRSYVGSA